MRYITESKSLLDNQSKLIKILDCPLHKKWDQLQLLDYADGFIYTKDNPRVNELKRHCASCKRDVVNISEFNEEQVKVLLKVDPEQCLYSTVESQNIEFVGNDENYSSRYRACCEYNVDVPVIQTARTLSHINHAAHSGFWPLIKEVKPSDEIKEKVLIDQSEDGSIQIHRDYRAHGWLTEIRYNPYQSSLPFAAYLIPKDLKICSRVYLPDLIEDIVGNKWNQGDSYRHKSAYATWNGKDLEIEYQEPGGFVG